MTAQYYEQYFSSVTQYCPTDSNFPFSPPILQINLSQGQHREGGEVLAGKLLHRLPPD